MANHKPMPPYDELSRHLKYDPCTGRAIWLISPTHTIPAGSIAGYFGKYHLIHYKNKLYKAHRLFWFLQTKQDPGDLTIDHIDENKLNNKFSNLRLATYSEQAQNISKRKSNKSGHRGVFWDKTRQKYLAFINFNGKFLNLGRYKTFEQAVATRQAKELELHGQFSPLHQLNND